MLRILAVSGLLGLAGCDGGSVQEISGVQSSESLSGAPRSDVTTARGEITQQVAFPMDQMTKGKRARVRDVVDGDTVTLRSGRDVRMVGTQSPKLPLGRPNFEPWPLGDAARDHLIDLADGREVTLYFGGREVDRNDRWLAHLIRDDGVWLQGAMLEAGYARVYTFADNRSGIRAMLAAEAIARAENRGIWAHPFYAVRTPRALEAAPEEFDNSFQIVSGRVKSTGQSRGRVFINFGGDWDTDFTAVISAGATRAFKDADVFDPDRLDGARVEIRGWITQRGGPSIDIDHPEQISFIK